MNLKLSLFAGLAGLVLFSCAGVLTQRPQGEITLLAWNVENLFDDVADGGEYPEFVPGKNWNTSAFFDRCQRIGDVLRQLPDGGADLVALEEVENENTVRVLRDRFLDGLGYGYLAMPPPTGSNIRVALLSRYPFVRTSVFYPTANDPSELPRGILEVELVTGSGHVVVLVNHWKSRLPSPWVTEPARLENANLLNSRLAAHELDASFPLILAVGDFNADVESSHDLPRPCMSAASNAFRIEGLEVWDSPLGAARSGWGWYDAWSSASATAGTYFYNGEWSHLDHVFVASKSLVGPGRRSVSATPLVTSTLLNANGTPHAWSQRDRKGVSDHLPLWVKIRLSDS